MNENFTTTELLIQYLEGDLDELQSAEVKKKMESDALVKEEFERLRIATGAIKEFGLKKSVALIHKEMMQEMQEPAVAPAGIVRKLIHYGLRIAAIVVVVAGSLLAYQYFSATPEKLFSENFAAFKMRETRGAVSSPLEEVYKKGNMPEVISRFNLLQQPGAEDYFLAGNALLSSRQAAKAIDAFITMQQKNATGKTHYYEEDAEYYLALSYLAAGETSKALPLMEKINADAHHPYHAHAGNWLLSKLRHISSK